MSTTRNLLRSCCYVLLATLFLGFPNEASAQTWTQPHPDLNFSSEPNTTDFQTMIGFTTGKELGQNDANFLAKNTLTSIRSFHIMESDFGERYFPKDGALKGTTCDCDDQFWIGGTACESADDCGEFFTNNGGLMTGFIPWKVFYCPWKTSSNYNMQEVYASLETNKEIADSTCGNPKTNRGYPDKWYAPDEWGANNTEIRNNAKEYAKAFAISFCPKASTGRDCVVDVLEVGNEPWGDIAPGPVAFKEINRGVIDGLTEYYGTSNKALWRMKLSTAAFIAWDDNFVGCFNDDNKYIGDMIPSDIRSYFDYIAIHPYAKTLATRCQSSAIDEMPESPGGAFLTIKNMKEWKDNNGMSNARINITEFGWNSEDLGACTPGSIVGEANQAAYHMRAYLLSARYDLHKTFSYGIYNSLAEPQFCSMGLIKGESGQREKKLVLLALENLMDKIDDKHFIKVVTENEREDGTIAYLLGDIDPNTGQATPTHLVAWKADYLGNTSSTAYPAKNSSQTSIGLPSPNMTVSQGSPYFYLGWGNSSQNEGTVGSGSSNTVAVNGSSNNTVNVRLSGLPIVIPINSGSCKYSSSGSLQNCSPCTDADNDGLCAVNDCDDNDAQIKYPGDSCNDGNSGTVNDVIQEDCSCAGVIGTIYNACLSDGIEIIAYGDAIEVNVSATDISYVKIMTPGGYSTFAYMCTNWSDPVKCDNGTKSVIPVPANTYRIQVAFTSGSPCYVENVVVGGCTDDDNDGICLPTDCDDDDAGIGAIGDPCDDGDPATSNDVIQADCTCAGEGGTVYDNCTGVTATVTGSEIEIDVAATNISYVKIMNENYSNYAYLCTNWGSPTYCTNGLNTSATVPANNYRVQVAYTSGSPCLTDLFTISSGSRVAKPSSSIKLYPNPASSRLWVDVGEKQPIGFMVYDVLGKVLESRMEKNTNFSLDLKTYQSGLYLIVIEFEGNERSSSRFIVK